MLSDISEFSKSVFQRQTANCLNASLFNVLLLYVTLRNCTPSTVHCSIHSCLCR